MIIKQAQGGQAVSACAHDHNFASAPAQLAMLSCRCIRFYTICNPLFARFALQVDAQMNKKKVRVART
eukprot:502804-Pleurochrysis_carterae.AAC.3